MEKHCTHVLLPTANISHLLEKIRPLNVTFYLCKRHKELRFLPLALGVQCQGTERDHQSA